MKKIDNKKAIILIVIIAIILLIVSTIIVYERVIRKSNIQENTEENIINQDIEENLLSEVDAESVLIDLYEKASQLYGTKLYSLDKDTNITQNGKIYYLAEDFYPIAQQFLTMKEIDKLKVGHPYIYIKNGIIYLQDVEKNAQYKNLKMSNIEITENSISAVVNLDLYINGEMRSQNIQSNFSIIKSDDEWLVDTYYDVSEIK